MFVERKGQNGDHVQMVFYGIEAIRRVTPFE